MFCENKRRAASYSTGSACPRGEDGLAARLPVCGHESPLGPGELVLLGSARAAVCVCVYVCAHVRSSLPPPRGGPTAYYTVGLVGRGCTLRAGRWCRGVRDRAEPPDFRVWRDGTAVAALTLAHRGPWYDTEMAIKY